MLLGKHDGRCRECGAAESVKRVFYTVDNTPGTGNNYTFI